MKVKHRVQYLTMIVVSILYNGQLLFYLQAAIKSSLKDPGNRFWKSTVEIYEGYLIKCVTMLFIIVISLNSLPKQQSAID